MAPRLDAQQQVANELVDTGAIDFTFDDVACTDDTISALREIALEPWEFPELYSQTRLLKGNSGTYNLKVYLASVCYM
jgi:hypothetical protein